MKIGKYLLLEIKPLYYEGRESILNTDLNISLIGKNHHHSYLSDIPKLSQ